MFNKNITKLANLGISLTALFESNIFCYTFDFNEWPSIHTDMNQSTRGYNGSIFDLRNSYRVVFPEEQFDILSE